MKKKKKKYELTGLTLQTRLTHQNDIKIKKILILNK